MSRIDIIIVVEGQTEQTFVRHVLAPYMALNGIYLYPSLIGRPGHKGGAVRFDRAKLDIGNFLKQRRSTHISTMFDYFRIDSDWPGINEIREQIQNGITLGAIRKAEILEKAICDEILRTFPEYNPEKRFIPYIEMHEFEALLFSDAKTLADKTGIDVSRFEKIIEEFTSPEEINDDPEGAPSKRLESLKTGYQKILMGKEISDAIGIPKIRKKCSHFNGWLTKFENLTGGANGED